MRSAVCVLRPPLQLSGPIRWPPLRPGRLNTTTRDTIGMGLIGKFFGVRKRRSDLSPEVVHIFEKIENFLISDDAQNVALPESLRKLIEAGAAVDELHGAKGGVWAMRHQFDSYQWSSRRNRLPVPDWSPHREPAYLDTGLDALTE